MALNKTFSGFAYLKDGSLAGDTVKYQALFYPNGTASSPTSWNAVRICESSSYWNFNLGDADFLGQEGVALVDSKIVIVFWSGDTSDRNSLCEGPHRLLEWGATEVTLTSADVYTLNIQVKDNILPNLVWYLSTDGLVGDYYTATNHSYDVHAWDFNGTSMHHYRTRYGQNIQLINTISGSVYDWGDGTIERLSGVANGQHHWSTAGSYDVKLTVLDECSDYTIDIKRIDIRFKEPVPNISCFQAVSNEILTPNTLVSFKYAGTDPNDRITRIDWVINDTGSYGDTSTTINNTTKDDIVYHSEGEGTTWCGNPATSGAFTNPGNHNIDIIIYWNDGFNDLTINYTEVFNQKKFSGPQLSFVQDPPKALLDNIVEFENTSTNTDRVGTGLPNCIEYDWLFKQDGSIVDEKLDVSYNYKYNVIPSAVDSIIGLRGHWNDGWDNRTAYIEDNIIFDTTVTVTPEDCYYVLDIIGTSLDGTISGYSWEVYKDTTTSGIGPWELIWESPTGIDQKTKKLGFTDVGYFKIVGYIYGGGTTFDDEILFIDEVCPVESEEIIWDGTGALDKPTDWTRLGYGTEASYARYSGTNGLDAKNLNTNQIIFTHPIGVDINSYESLSFYVKLYSNGRDDDINIKMRTKSGKYSDVLKLSNYIKLEEVNTWQRVIINMEDFGFIQDAVSSIILTGEKNVSLYLDTVYFSAVKVFYKAVQVCEVDMVGISSGAIFIEGEEVMPVVYSKEVVPVVTGQSENKPNIIEKETPKIGKPKFPLPRLH